MAVILKLAHSPCQCLSLKLSDCQCSDLQRSEVSHMEEEILGSCHLAGGHNLGRLVLR